MIGVNAVTSRSRARTLGRIEVEQTGVVHLRVRSMERSIAFYRRLFGWRPADAQRDAAPSCTLSLPGGARLVLHSHGSPAAERVPMQEGFGVIVADLDFAREAIWDLGVPVASDSGQPDQIYRWPNGRSLHVNDPDGHDIELLETGFGLDASLAGLSLGTLALGAR